MYVTDALKATSKNTSSMLGGTFIEDSYNDLINGNNTKEDDADPEEIIIRIKGKLAKIGNGKEDSHGPISVKG